MLSPKTKHKIQTTYDLELYEHPGTNFAMGVVILISKNVCHDIAQRVRDVDPALSAPH